MAISKKFTSLSFPVEILKVILSTSSIWVALPSHYKYHRQGWVITQKTTKETQRHTEFLELVETLSLPIMQDMTAFLQDMTVFVFFNHCNFTI